jgi:Straboviridae/Kyanoviridae head completion nuclease
MAQRYQGVFTPKNPQKYLGDVNRIVFRSLWERRVMIMFDEDDRVLKWNSEEVIVPYRSPKDGLIHRYFVDFCVQVKLPNGTTKIRLVEVKPSNKLVQPVPKKKITNKFLKELLDYEVIQSKKRAAEAYCADRGWEYVFLTEHDLFPKKAHK